MSDEYSILVERAKEIDPSAFVAVNAPQYTDDQLSRQAIAMRKAALKVS